MSNESAIINASALAAYINTINEQPGFVRTGDPKPYVDLEVTEWVVKVKMIRNGSLDGRAVVMYLEKAQELGAKTTYVERTGGVVAEFRS